MKVEFWIKTKRVSRLSTIYQKRQNFQNFFGQNLPETTKDYYNVSKSTSLNKILTPLSRNPCFIKPMIYVPVNFAFNLLQQYHIMLLAVHTTVNK